MKIIYTTFFVLLAIAFFNDIRNVSADNFYPSGDSYNCNFAQVGSISISSLPIQSTSSGGITFNSGLVVNTHNNYPQTHTIKDVADLLYPNARRYNNIWDRVAGPPGSVVEVGYFPYNYSGHQVNVSKAYLFTSDSSLGDWTKLGATGTEGSISYLLSGNYVTKTGKYIEINNIGIWYNNSFYNPPLGKPIYSFTILDPLKVEYVNKFYHFDENANLIVEIKVKITNTSSYFLENIRYYHNPFQLVRNFNPNEEFEFTYAQNMGMVFKSRVDLGSAELSNTNSQEECVVLGVNNNVDNNPSSHFIITKRNDLFAPLDWQGLQIDFPTIPTGKSMCIKRIGYTKWLEELFIEVPTEIVLETNISDSDEIELSEITSDQGENIEMQIIIRNSSRNIKNAQINIQIPEIVEYISNDCGLENGENGLSKMMNSFMNGDILVCIISFRSVKDYNFDYREGIFNIGVFEKDFLLADNRIKLILKPLSGYSIVVDSPEYALIQNVTSTSITLVSASSTNLFYSSINFTCNYCDIENSDFISGEDEIYQFEKEYVVNIYWDNSSSTIDTICYEWKSDIPQINEKICRNVTLLSSDFFNPEVEYSNSVNLQNTPEYLENILNEDVISYLLDNINTNEIFEITGLSFSGEKGLIKLEILIIFVLIIILISFRIFIKKSTMKKV